MTDDPTRYTEPAPVRMTPTVLAALALATERHRLTAEELATISNTIAFRTRHGDAMTTNLLDFALHGVLDTRWLDKHVQRDPTGRPITWGFDPNGLPTREDMDEFEREVERDRKRAQAE